jgi:hypothetical protein
MAPSTVAPRFTRCHYEQVADVISGVRAGFDEGGSCQFGVECTADALAAMFSEDNPRFDNERFRNACGIVGEA